MAAGLSRPWWWKGDFDTTGKTQLGWAKEAAAKYRENAAKEAETQGSRQSDGDRAQFEALKKKIGVTPSVTPPESVTPSASVTPFSVTPPVTPSDAERKRRWREQNWERSLEINRAPKARQKALSAE